MRIESLLAVTVAQIYTCSRTLDALFRFNLFGLFLGVIFSFLSLAK